MEFWVLPERTKPTVFKSVSLALHVLKCPGGGSTICLMHLSSCIILELVLMGTLQRHSEGRCLPNVWTFQVIRRGKRTVIMLKKKKKTAVVVYLYTCWMQFITALMLICQIAFLSYQII
ncbi:hypothetical protein XENTR_v10017020 [Xenopus tropicalis]|nr:hypothetical protein XENTR_v10017020 [Xenopus tropicalis]